AKRCNLGNRIHARGRSSSDRSNEGERPESKLSILRDDFAQDRRLHSEFAVAWHATHIFFAKAKRDRRFLGRTVGLIRSVNPKSRKVASGQTKFTSGWRSLFAGDGERMHDPDRCGVVNDAVKIWRQMHPLPQP